MAHQDKQYFSILDFCIAVILWSGCFVSWVSFLTHHKIYPAIWTDCKLFYFIFYYGRHYSSMLLVLMSIEKCFAVYFPLKSKTVCTVKTAKWSTGTVGVILAGYNLQWFAFYKSRVSKSSDYTTCVYTEHHHIAFDIIDSVLYSFGPFALMLVTNFAIIFKFIRAKCNTSNSTESTNQALAKSATRGTAMVVTVSVTFILLTYPTALFDALSDIINVDQYRVFMNLTQYLNHSINGILYILVGSRFREEFLKLFNRKKNNTNLSSSHSIKTISLGSIDSRMN